MNNVKYMNTFVVKFEYSYYVEWIKNKIKIYIVVTEVNKDRQ